MRGKGWPIHLLPITTADNGDMCLVLDGEEKGVVYFLHAGQGAEPKLEENLYFVANSFDEFMRMLK